MSRQLKACSGFVFVELTIALPLLILLTYTLANVVVKISEHRVTVKVGWKFGGKDFEITCERRMRVVPTTQSS